LQEKEAADIKEEKKEEEIKEKTEEVPDWLK